MAGRFSGSGLLKRFACLAVALAALVPLGALAHRAHDHEQPPAESQGAATAQWDSAAGAVHAVSRSCPGGSENACCCAKLPFSNSTVKTVAVVTAGWVMAVPYLASRLEPLAADEELPALRSLPSSPPRAPPGFFLTFDS
jgi:hypothetical protein